MHGPHDIGFEKGRRVLLDTAHPIDAIEPMPSDDSLEREAFANGIKWTIALIGDSGRIVAKILALNYLLRQSEQSLEELGRPFGISKQAIDRWVGVYSDALAIPRIREAARSSYSARAKRTWNARKHESRTP